MTIDPSSTQFKSHLFGALAYLFGCFSGIVLLLIVRDDRYVRFHAIQSTLTFLAVLVLAAVLGEVPLLGRLLSWMLSISTVVLWLFLMFKAITGERYQLPYIGEIADRQN